MNLTSLLLDPRSLHLAGQILSPLALAGIILAGRGITQRSVLILSIGGLVLLVGGTVVFVYTESLYDSQILMVQSNPALLSSARSAIVLAARVLSISSDMAFVGYYMTVGALVLGLILTARRGRRSWFAALVLSLTLLLVIGMVPFLAFANDLPFAVYPFPFHSLFSFSYRFTEAAKNCRPDLGPYPSCDLGALVTFNLIMTALTAVAPLVAVFYGLRGPDRAKPALPVIPDEVALSAQSGIGE